MHAHLRRSPGRFPNLRPSDKRHDVYKSQSQIDCTWLVAGEALTVVVVVLLQIGTWLVAGRNRRCTPRTHVDVVDVLMSPMLANCRPRCTARRHDNNTRSSGPRCRPIDGADGTQLVRSIN